MAELALSSALSLTPAEFDRRWREGGPSALKLISCNDPAGRQQAAVTALGELLQAADSVCGPLQPQYRQQAAALVEREHRLWGAAPLGLRASWASLQQLGLSDSQLREVIDKQPAVLAYNWDGEAKPRLLAWVQQELGLSPVDFLTRHAGYVTNSVATIAMRADFLRQHRPALWQDVTSRGTGPLLSLLTKAEFFFARSGCTQAELAAFNRAWLATPAGRRWGAKPRRAPRRHVS